MIEFMCRVPYKFKALQKYQIVACDSKCHKQCSKTINIQVCILNFSDQIHYADFSEASSKGSTNFHKPTNWRFFQREPFRALLHTPGDSWISSLF